jgi:hypothetical protein
MGLPDERTVEESFVEMMAVAVVAKIQAENIIPLAMEESPGGQYIGRVSPPFPPMKKEDQSTGGPGFLTGVKPEQTDAVPRIN